MDKVKFEDLITAIDQLCDYLLAKQEFAGHSKAEVVRKMIVELETKDDTV